MIYGPSTLFGIFIIIVTTLIVFNIVYDIHITKEYYKVLWYDFHPWLFAWVKGNLIKKATELHISM